MLMTIDNLYEKCQEERTKDVFPLVQKYHAQFSEFADVKNFNDVQKRGYKAQVQLRILTQAVKHFKKLKADIKKKQNQKVS